MEEEAPLDAFLRNGYHLFVDVLNRLMQETESEAMLAFYKLVWRYFTRWWSELSPAQVCGLNKNLAERIGGLLSRTPSLKGLQDELELDRRIFPASRSVNNEVRRAWGVNASSSSPVQTKTQPKHHGWTPINAPHLRSRPDGPEPSSSHTAQSLARISHYYAAKHYGLDGRRWEMQAQL
ncbi:uncharacterized protein JCM10292_004764 [Rhodotorula paludigena]|uniref:uncharacterized protein n=1 Tax=Rhodotorula paludigena TaxID=86838 RepID=UPI00317105C9